MKTRLLVGILLLILATKVFGATLNAPPNLSSRRCRCLPADRCWPSLNEWKELNSSVSGRLLNAAPPAYQCHDPNFQSQECSAVHHNWENGYWRADHPTAMQFTNWEVLANETWECQLDTNASIPCKHGNIPVYVVNVTSAQDIQRAVLFAIKHNLRVAIKNSGHDLLGRSTAAGSLGIWTRHLTHIELHDRFVPVNSSSNGTTAVTVQTGVQGPFLYEAVAKKNWVVVGGAANTVAVAGGFVGGGGHSPLSTYYGLAADNALQFTVALGNGNIVVANGAQHTDLFWALRGGGPGTWGVVVDVTFRTYPGPKIVSYASYDAQVTNETLFALVMEKFVELQPEMSRDGFSGYWHNTDQVLHFAYTNLNKNISETKKLMEPFLNYTSRLGVKAQFNLTEYPNWNDWWLSFGCPSGACLSSGGGSSYAASRLIPTKTFSQPQKLASVLIKVYKENARNNGVLLGNFVSGGEVAKRHPDSVAVNPAWRKALWHIVLPARFDDNATVAERTAIHRRLTAINGYLRDITPGSGCYLNEADTNEPNWQQAFFGSHYDRLKKIKNAVDPKHLFICHHCVGSDDWDESLNCRVR